MSDSTAPSDAMNLGTLEDDYSIVGELRGAIGRRIFLAIRRSDGSDASIAIFSSAAGLENNALTHFAADTKMLMGLRHGGVIQPLDARWIGATDFAVVSDRPDGAPLRQLLAAGERYTPAQVASLLQTVNGILSWAREQGVMHRGVSLDSVFFEPASGRLQLALLPTPISLDRVPDALADSTTIGKLAWALLAARPLDGGEAGEAGEALGSIRPDLAARVVEAVERMRAAPGDVVHPEVADFLSTIATADVLKTAELELESQRAEYAELVRVQRETAEAERTACERRAAEIEEKLTNDRRAFELEVERVRAELASERAQLAVEREQLAYEVGSLQQRRTSDQPAPVVPESTTDLAWPDVDRRAHPRRFLGPLLVAAALVVAALAVHFTEPRTTPPHAIAVGTDTIVPTLPTLPPSRLPRGGFLSQTAAGTVSPRMATQTPTVESTTAAAAAPVSPTPSSSTSGVPAPVGAPRAQTVAGDSAARLDSAARRATQARKARRDSLQRRDSSLHRDSLGFLRRDTLPRQ